MPTAAIICEYNPFHNGHEYQINKIREILGEDTKIIAIMSGNFTQRGECAIMDKGHRAKIAVMAGVNLVLELPFPFSSLSAELFARAGVHIANSLNTVDYLAFGCECGDIIALEECALAMLTPEYEKQLLDYIKAKEYKALGYPELIELALKDVMGIKSPVALSPNNILALEYIKALKREGSSIKPLAIKREGAGYNSEKIEKTKLQSASAIRNSLYEKDISALEYTPSFAKDIIIELLASGDFPTDISRLDTAIISHFRLSSPTESKATHDSGGGLYNLLRSASFEANDYNTLLRLAETKNVTRAKLRRAILFSYLGVTSSEARDLPRYTQTLALDKDGMALLKEIRKQNSFPILTKPSNTRELSAEAMRQKLQSDRADSVYQLTKPCPRDGRSAVRFTPFIKK